MQEFLRPTAFIDSAAPNVVAFARQAVGAETDSVARDISSRALADDIGCAYAADHAAVRAWVAREARPGDTVLIMGARDPELPRLAREVFASLG